MFYDVAVQKVRQKLSISKKQEMLYVKKIWKVKVNWLVFYLPI